MAPRQKATPRVQGAGSVDALPSGRFRVRFTHEGSTLTKTFDARAEAEAYRVALVQERKALAADAPRPEAPPAVETLDSWFKVWMHRRETTGAVRWPRIDRGRWQTHVAGTPLASKPLAEVRPRDVRDWLASMMGKRGPNGKLLNRQTVTHAFNLVRGALGAAVKDERIPTNPAAGEKVDKRPEKRDTDPWTFLSAEEVTAVETCSAMPDGVRLLFTVAIRTGLRAGELWALRWVDVDTRGKHPAVTVRASHHGAPKNGKVQRVPLLPAAREAFDALRALAGDVEPDDLVFPSSTGAQRGRGDDGRWAPEHGPKGAKVARWPGYRALAGINRGVRFHDLRHTCASHLVMGSWTEKPLTLPEVQTMLRHGSPTMTARYAHLSPDHLHARLTASPSPRPAVALAGLPGLPSAPSPPADLNPPVVALSGVTTAVTDSTPAGMSRGTLRPHETASFQGAPEGTRTPDPRLRRPQENACFQGVFARGDEPTTDSSPLSSCALALLHAVDEGTPAGPIARELAVAVLRRCPPDSPPWSLAVAVLDGGPFRMRRAVELAGLVLDAVEVDPLHLPVVANAG